MSGPQSLQELRDAVQTRPPWFADLDVAPTADKKPDRAAWSALDDAPDVVAVRVQGLDQAGLEYLASHHAARLVAIDFFRCPRIADFSPLEDMANLRVVSSDWNQQAVRFWDLARTPALASLGFNAFTQLHRLDDLAAGASLVELDFSDIIWPKSTVETLEPLAGLTGLRGLSIHIKRVDDGRLQPLAGLIGLNELYISTNLFTTEQFAWIRARLPESVVSNVLGPLSWLGGDAHPSPDVVLVGKGKPMLRTDTDAARIAQHVQRFDEMVAAFRADPSRQPA